MPIWHVCHPSGLPCNSTPAVTVTGSQRRTTSVCGAPRPAVPSQRCLLVPPCCAVIVTGSQDRTAKVWRMPDLVLSLTLKGHKRGIWAVAFSPVDQAVATASGECRSLPLCRPEEVQLQRWPACLAGIRPHDALE